MNTIRRLIGVLAISTALIPLLSSRMQGYCKMMHAEHLHDHAAARLWLERKSRWAQIGEHPILGPVQLVLLISYLSLLLLHLIKRRSSHS